MWSKALAVFCLVSVTLAATCYQAPFTPQDRRVDKTKLSVATYNAEWLFLANRQDPSKCSEAGCQYQTLEEALMHVKDVAAELQYINADIVNLVEVEGCEVLEKLVEYIGESYGYKYYLVQGDDTFTGQNTALLTRIDPSENLQRSNDRVTYPVSNSTCPGKISSSNYGVSKNYYTRFELKENGMTLNLFSVHLLAYPDDEDRCFKREAQAQVMANYIDRQYDQGENTIILGDFNDYDSSLQDINSNIPISNTVEIIRSSLSPWMYNAGNRVFIVDERYSAWYDRNDNCASTPNEFSVIDHLIVDNNLRSKLVSTEYVHNYPATCKSAISDHFPIKVEFSLQ